MISFDAGLFADVLHDLSSVEAVLAQPSPWLDEPKHRAYYDKKLELLIAELEHLGLKVSKKKAVHLRVMISTTIKTFTEEASCRSVRNHCGGLRENLMYELDGRKFYGPIDGYAKYYDQVQLFGKDVFDNFASANEDIYEAGMCLSLERGTACVMHLMRVQEAGLKALAAAVGVTDKNDWGTYLRDIHTALDQRAKSAGARSEAEQFYAESAATFDRLKRAYRTPTMHPDKSYSPERAEQILLAAKDFMATLATRLSEVP